MQKSKNKNIRILRNGIICFQLNSCYSVCNMAYVSYYLYVNIIFKEIINSWRQEFNYGVEFVLLMSFLDNAIEPIEDALASLGRLIVGCPSLIAQHTQGLFK